MPVWPEFRRRLEFHNQNQQGTEKVLACGLRVPGSGFYDFASDEFQDFSCLFRVQADRIELFWSSKLEFDDILQSLNTTFAGSFR